MPEHARVISAAARSLTATLLEDHAIGESTLNVDDIAYFDELGGTLQINGELYTYTAADDAAGTITLAGTLTTAADAGDLVEVWDTEAASVATEVVALITLDDVDQLGDPPEAVVRHDLIPYIPLGIRTDTGESVVVERNQSGAYIIVSILGKTSVIDGSYIDPDTIPDPSTPVVAPTESPALTVTGSAEALIVQAEPVDPSTTIEYHLSTTDGFTPDTSTLVVATRQNVITVTQQPDGTPLAVNTSYYLRSVATNAAGAAPASDQVTGQLDPDAVTNMVVASVVSGIVMAGRFESGAGYWDPDEGLVLPQPDGTITRLSTDGVTPSTLAGFAILIGATIKDNLSLYGTTQLSGRFVVGDGVSDPTVGPTISKTHEVATHGEDLFNYLFGLTPHVGSSTDVVSLLSFLGEASFRKFNKTTGARDPFVFSDAGIEGTAGGITTIGTSYYALGVRGGVTKVVAYDATFTETGSWTTDFGTSPGYRWTIGTDGTNVVLAHIINAGANAGKAMVRTFNKTTGAQIGGDVVCNQVINKNLQGVYVGNADYGAARIVLAVEGNTTYVFNSTGTHQATQSWTTGASSTARGLCWDGTNFFGLDAGQRIWKYNGHTTTLAITGSSTWYDGDAGGGTHETAESPDTAFTWSARSRLVIAGAPAPDEDNTDPTLTDKANIVRIYAGTGGTRRLQATLAVGVTSLTLDSLDTGSAVAPTTSTFSDSSAAPGEVESAAVDGGGAPLTSMKGDGTFWAKKFMQASVVSTGAFSAVETVNSIAVVFDVPFDAPPAIGLTIEAPLPNNLSYPVTADTVTATGFNIKAVRKNGLAAYDVHWTATVRTQ